MSRRLRRVPAALLPLVLLGSLAACGSSDSSSSTDPLSAVSISGDPGKAPQVTWKSQMETDSIQAKTLHEGDGPKIESGDSVQANIWIGDGFTKEKAFSTYEQGGPQVLKVDSSALSPVFLKAVEGHTIGSRVAVTAPADKVFGQTGNPKLGIANKDAVLLIVDLVKQDVPPKPVDVSASKLPKVVEKKGKPVALDFTGVPKPKADGDLLRSVIKEGNGPTVTEDMTVTANYLGQVYGAKQPFDESFSKKPVPFSLQSVVKGWTYGLSGVKVGSRVLLAIPPSLGYGDQAQQGIPANSTLYFVVDILKAQ